MRRDVSDDLARAARSRLEDLARHWGGPGGPDRYSDPNGDGATYGETDEAGEVDSFEDDDTLIGPVSLGGIPAYGRHARAGVGPLPRLRVKHLGLLALVGTVAVILAVWLAFRGAPTPVPVASTTHPTGIPAAAGAAEPGAVRTPASTSTDAPSSTSPGVTAGTVVVDVTGRVRRPGVATLPSGSRVIDALRRAGGARVGVDLSTLNLARVLVDGEQIVVGLRAPAGVAAGAVAAPPSTSTTGEPAALVNLNTATLDALEGLPGVGPVTAQKILDWRTAHGRFSAVDELLEVGGIGPKTLAEIAPGVTL